MKRTSGLASTGIVPAITATAGDRRDRCCLGRRTRTGHGFRRYRRCHVCALYGRSDPPELGRGERLFRSNHDLYRHESGFGRQSGSDRHQFHQRRTRLAGNGLRHFASRREGRGTAVGRRQQSIRSLPLDGGTPPGEGFTRFTQNGWLEATARAAALRLPSCWDSTSLRELPFREPTFGRNLKAAIPTP